MSNRFQRLRAVLPFVLLPLACAIAMHLLNVDDAQATARDGDAGRPPASTKAPTPRDPVDDVQGQAAPSPIVTTTH